MNGLAEELLVRVAEPVRAELEGMDSLENSLQARIAKAQTAWPQATVPAKRFIAYVADRVPDEDTEPGDPLERLNWEDLYLACACSEGNEGAIAAFELAHFPDLDKALAQLDTQGTLTDEVKQILRTRLFAGESPKILDYSGRSTLKRWLRVAAVRTAVSYMKRQQRQVQLTDDVIVGASNDLELDYLKRTYRDEFQRAFTDSFQQLSAKDRTLLRLHVIDGLSIDQIGSFHQVHRATAARWLTTARQGLASGIKALLSQRLKVDAGELDSIMRLVRSRIDISMRMLKTRGEIND